jgi:hypothetical protein
MMAENGRLSQLTTEEQGEEDSESKGSEGKSSGSDDLWSDLIERADINPPKNVILVMGAAGSGVLANASQVLTRLAGNDTESDSSALKRVSSALVVIDLSQDFPEKVTRDGIEDILARSDSQNVIVSVITSAVGHVSITSVISKMEACGCNITYSIAVIAAQSIENYLQSHPRFVILYQLACRLFILPCFTTH